MSCRWGVVGMPMAAIVTEYDILDYVTLLHGQLEMAITLRYVGYANSRG